MCVSVRVRVRVCGAHTSCACCERHDWTQRVITLSITLSITVGDASIFWSSWAFVCISACVFVREYTQSEEIKTDMKIGEVYKNKKAKILLKNSIAFQFQGGYLNNEK